MANTKRDSEGRFASNGVLGSLRDRPLTSAALAAGAAAAGAFLWSRRAQIGEQAGKLGERVSEQYDRASERFASGSDNETTGMDPASEAKSKRIRSARSTKSQSEISRDALDLKQAGETTPEGDIQQQSKVGAIAY